MRTGSQTEAVLSLLYEGHGAVEGWFRWSESDLQTPHVGCTRGQNPVILSSMTVCEDGGPGMSSLPAGLLAYGWSGAGAAS